MTIGAGHKQIGQLLLQAGVIDDLQLRSALGHQRQWGGRLGRILVELKFIDESTLASTLARQLGLESTRITGEGIDPKVVALVPQTVAERYWIFPLSFKDSKGGGELTVAVSDPTNLASVEDVRFHTGKRIKVVVAPESDIEGAIKRFYYGDAAAALAVSPAGEEVFASTPTSLSPPEFEFQDQPEEELLELEPIPTDSVPIAAAPADAGGDPLDDFFDGLTPPPPTGAEALFDFGSPEPAAVEVPETTPPAPRPATLVPVARPLVPEAPAPIHVEASAFDSPHLSTMFEPASAVAVPSPSLSETVEVAPFATEEEIAIEMKSMPTGIPTQTQPVITLVPALAIAEPYPEPVEEEPPPPVPEAPQPIDAPEEAFAVDMHADADVKNEGAPFAALAPPLVGAAAAPPTVETLPLPEIAGGPSPELETSPMVVEAAFAALAEPEPPSQAGAEEPSLAMATEEPSAAGALGSAPFTEGELEILDSLEARVATGVEPAQVIKPGQLVSALIRLMIRKGLLAEAELIEELQKR